MGSSQFTSDRTGPGDEVDHFADDLRLFFDESEDVPDLPLRRCDRGLSGDAPRRSVPRGSVLAGVLTR